MFYDRFAQLCSERHISPSKAAVEAGLSKSTVSKWKNSPESKPTGAALEKLSAYFDIPIAEVLGEENEKPSTGSGDELSELLERLKNRPECRMLFQLADGATAEDVRKAVAIIEALRKEK